MTSRDLMDSLFLEDDDVEVFISPYENGTKHPLYLDAVTVGEHPVAPGKKAIILWPINRE